MWLWFTACAISRPFEGPGMEGGEVVSDHEGPFLVAATHAKSAKGEGDAFDDHVAAIQAELESMDEESGLVGYALRGELGGRDNWTMTLWTSEEAMFAFVLGDVHVAAMSVAGTVLEEGHFAHWEESDVNALPPSWSEALDALEATER